MKRQSHSAQGANRSICKLALTENKVRRPVIFIPAVRLSRMILSGIAELKDTASLFNFSEAA
ncbi:MAG: hypothetical protein ACLQVJ_03745 [Syntrophobacteraceae bacterium]